MPKSANSQNESTPPFRSHRISRLAILGLVFLVELALLAMIRSLGWLDTLGSLRWAASVAFFATPLVIIGFLLGLRSRRFSLRTLLIATAFAAVFIALFMFPYATAKSSRGVTQVLRANGIDVSLESSLDNYYESLGVEIDGPKSLPHHVTPFWIAPLMGDLPVVHAEEILELGLWSDEQVSIALTLHDKLPNLRRIRVYGRRAVAGGGTVECVTSDGLANLAKHLPQIEALAIVNVEMPGTLCYSFGQVRTLTVLADDLNETQLADIATTPGMEFIRISGCNINDEGATILAKAAQLRVLDLLGTQVSDDAASQIHNDHPHLRVRLGH